MKPVDGKAGRLRLREFHLQGAGDAIRGAAKLLATLTLCRRRARRVKARSRSRVLGSSLWPPAILSGGAGASSCSRFCARCRAA